MFWRIYAIEELESDVHINSKTLEIKYDKRKEVLIYGA